MSSRGYIQTTGLLLVSLLLSLQAFAWASEWDARGNLIERKPWASEWGELDAFGLAGKPSLESTRPQHITTATIEQAVRACYARFIVCRGGGLKYGVEGRVRVASETFVEIEDLQDPKFTISVIHPAFSTFSPVHIGDLVYAEGTLEVGPSILIYDARKISVGMAARTLTKVAK